MTQMSVEVEQQQLTHIQSPSASAVRSEDAQATCPQQEIAEEAEEIEKGDDGLLLFPTHLSGSLRRLEIHSCGQLSLVAYPPLPNGYKTGREGEGGLHALRSLQELEIKCCDELFSAYKTLFPNICFPFPSSLKLLKLSSAEGMWTLEPISNLTSLTQLNLSYCGNDLRGESLWPLVTQGQLSKLWVHGSPKFFDGSDPRQGLQDDNQELLRRSSKLRELRTNDVAGFLAAPICNILSSSLAMLTLDGNLEVEVMRFTKEQEDALQLLTSLEDLKFVYFKKLQGLPTCLHTLPKLKRLKIWSCELISSLPKDGLPVSLQELNVRSSGNAELKQQCRNFILDHPGIELIDQF